VDQFLDTTEIYDPSANTWSAGPILPEKKSHLCLVAASKVEGAFPAMKCSFARCTTLLSAHFRESERACLRACLLACPPLPARPFGVRGNPIKEFSQERCVCQFERELFPRPISIRE